MKNCIFIALFALSILGTGSPANCYELPENASRELTELLSHKEFQPRGAEKSALRKSLEKRIEAFLEELTAIFNAGSGKIRNRESSDFWDIALQMLHDFSSWFLNILGNLIEATFYLSALSLICLIIYKLYKLSLNKDALTETKISSDNSQASRISFDYNYLLKNGDLLGALVNFRKKLREQLDQEHRLAKSLTDREIIRKLEQETPLLNIFQRAALIFEKTAYAGAPPNEQTISELLSDYEGKK